MNVYTKANSVFELAFEQEQCASCEQLISLAESNRIRLILPAYCSAEPHEKLIRQKRTRIDLLNSASVVFNQLVLTTSLTPGVRSVQQDLSSIIAQSNEEESKRFALYRKTLLATTEIIPLTASVLSDAVDDETPLNLSGQDAIVYASITNHTRKRSKSVSCFLNKNTKDFDAPDIISELAKYGCQLIPRFDHGLNYVQNQLNQ